MKPQQLDPLRHGLDRLDTRCRNLLLFADEDARPACDEVAQCNGVYAPGATVTLTAKAYAGSVFSMWSGACAGNASNCKLPMNAESTVTATFAAQAAGGEFHQVGAPGPARRGRSLESAACLPPSRTAATPKPRSAS